MRTLIGKIKRMSLPDTSMATARINLTIAMKEASKAYLSIIAAGRLLDTCSEDAMIKLLGEYINSATEDCSFGVKNMRFYLCGNINYSPNRVINDGRAIRIILPTIKVKLFIFVEFLKKVTRIDGYELRLPSGERVLHYHTVAPSIVEDDYRNDSEPSDCIGWLHDKKYPVGSVFGVMQDFLSCINLNSIGCANPRVWRGNPLQGYPSATTLTDRFLAISNAVPTQALLSNTGG